MNVTGLQSSRDLQLHRFGVWHEYPFLCRHMVAKFVSHEQVAGAYGHLQQLCNKLRGHLQRGYRQQRRRWTSRAGTFWGSAGTWGLVPQYVAMANNDINDVWVGGGDTANYEAPIVYHSTDAGVLGTSADWARLFKTGYSVAAPENWATVDGRLTRTFRLTRSAPVLLVRRTNLAGVRPGIRQPSPTDGATLRS